jgi:hypothetical protein
MPEDSMKIFDAKREQRYTHIQDVEGRGRKGNINITA